MTVARAPRHVSRIAHSRSSRATSERIVLSAQCTPREQGRTPPQPLRPPRSSPGAGLVGTIHRRRLPMGAADVRCPKRESRCGVRVASKPVGTPWDAQIYDRSSQPQQEWASDVLDWLDGVARTAAILDVGAVPAGSPVAAGARAGREGSRDRCLRGDSDARAAATRFTGRTSTARTRWRSIWGPRSTLSSRPRRCTGVPTTIGCGRVWRMCCGGMACSRTNAAGTATSIACAR